jgi:sphingomyelin phosphodiesterase 2
LSSTYLSHNHLAIRSGALGSGLAIFTKFPIISAQALPYSLSGLPLAVIAGDFFVNKAAGSVAILHPDLGEVEIWNTHVRLMSGLDVDGAEIDEPHVS